MTLHAKMTISIHNSTLKAVGKHKEIIKQKRRYLPHQIKVSRVPLHCESMELPFVDGCSL